MSSFNYTHYGVIYKLCMSIGNWTKTIDSACPCNDSLSVDNALVVIYLQCKYTYNVILVRMARLYVCSSILSSGLNYKF